MSGDFDFFAVLADFCSQQGSSKAAQASLREWEEACPNDFIRVVVATVCGDVSEYPSAPAGLGSQERFVAMTMLVSFMKQHSKLLEGDAMVYVRDSMMNILATDATIEPGMSRKICVILRRCARELYPHNHWPELPDQIMELINNAEENYRQRWNGLMLAHQVMIELHAMKVDDSAFEGISARFAEPTRQWISFLGNNLVQNTSGDFNQDLELFVLSAKIGQRVFCGTVDEATLRQLTSLLVELLQSPRAECYEKGIERLIKIMLCIVDEHANEISTVFSREFFADFLPLLADLIEKFCKAQKIAGRAIQIISRMLEFMDCDEGIQQIMGDFFGNQEQTNRMLSVLIHNYFGDEDDMEENEWYTDPEDYVLEHDVQDDFDELDKCSEQLFLRIVESGGQPVQTIAWDLINEILGADNSGPTALTAALRAIGICYDALGATDEAKAQYHTFLFNTLIPLVKGNSVETSSFVIRRVIWVIGMWCQNVPDVSDRRQIHDMLSTVLETNGDAVIVLTTLRTLENFISDVERFDPQQMTEAEGVQALTVIENMMPKLNTPSMVKELAGLVHAIFKNGVNLPSGFNFGEVVMRMFRPSLKNFMNSELQDDEGEEQTSCAAFCMVLDALSSSVHLFETSEEVWQLMGVVQYCTNIDNCVHTWTEGHAWELLAAMCSATRTVPNPAMHQTLLECLQWCVQNCDRDFDGIEGCIKAVTSLTLLFLCEESCPDNALDVVCQLACKLLNTMEYDAYDQAVALADILCLKVPNTVGSMMMQVTVDILTSDDDVQADPRTPGAAFLLCRLLSSPEGPNAWGTLDDGMKSELCERLGLTNDVCPSRYGSRLVVATMASIAAQGGFPTQSDVNYVRDCIESEHAGDADEDEKVREGISEMKDAFRMYLDLIKDDTREENYNAHHSRLKDALDAVNGTLDISNF